MSIRSDEPHDHPPEVIDPGPRRYPPSMEQYLGLPIKRICHNAVVNQAGQNHCAHFVCHVMRWQQIPGAVRCNFLSHADTAGVHIRVDEVFNYAPDRGSWSPPEGELDDPCLVVATIASNVRHSVGQGPTIGQHARKHLGIYHRGRLWH